MSVLCESQKYFGFQKYTVCNIYCLLFFLGFRRRTISLSYLPCFHLFHILLILRYTNIDLRKDVTDGMAIRAELGTMIGRTSVPAIWIQQQYLGGCNDGGPNNSGISGLNDNGQLDELLRKAGVM